MRRMGRLDVIEAFVFFSFFLFFSPCLAFVPSALGRAPYPLLMPSTFFDLIPPFSFCFLLDAFFSSLLLTHACMCSLARRHPGLPSSLSPTSSTLMISSFSSLYHHDTALPLLLCTHYNPTSYYRYIALNIMYSGIIPERRDSF